MGQTRSVGWSLNYIRESTTRQAWEPSRSFFDVYRQFSIVGTQKELGASVLFGWVVNPYWRKPGGVHRMVFTEKVRRQGVTGWTASHKGTPTI